MDVAALITSIDYDLENEYGLKWIISVCESGEGDINLEFAPNSDSDDNCVIGFNLYLFYTSVSLELTAINPPAFMDSVFKNISRNGREHISQITEFEELLESRGGRITYQINGRKYPDAQLKSLENIHWKSFSARYDSDYIDTHYRLDFNYNGFRQIILDYAGYILLFSNYVNREQAFYEEGQKFIETSTKYERNPINRRICLSSKGYACSVCGLKMEDKYGGIGRDFIEVHHVVPVSEYDGARYIDPLKELFPVCPNCHAMLHRRKPPYSIEELKKMITRHVGGEKDESYRQRR